MALGFDDFAVLAGVGMSTSLFGAGLSSLFDSGGQSAQAWTNQLLAQQYMANLAAERDYGYSSKLQCQQAAQNKALAKYQYELNEQAQQSAYQRNLDYVKDYKQALIDNGYNPMLALGGQISYNGSASQSGLPSVGSSAFHGSSASGGVSAIQQANRALSASQFANTALTGMNVYAGLSRLGAEVENIKADTAKKVSDATLSEAQALRAGAEAVKAEADTKSPGLIGQGWRAAKEIGREIMNGLGASYDDAPGAVIDAKKVSENSAEGLKGVTDVVNSQSEEFKKQLRAEARKRLGEKNRLEIEGRRRSGDTDATRDFDVKWWNNTWNGKSYDEWSSENFGN
ncbi:minor capsid protein [Capybara microvirus Cap1_SP_163]|nr:minor capsid protein [Capybara microvirus Cap1_SP_163]